MFAHILQSGTTACIATVEAAPSHLLTIANVGDSRALLLQRAQHSSIWQAVQLTTDHKPDCESERRRVMSKGEGVSLTTTLGCIHIHSEHYNFYLANIMCSQCEAQLVVAPERATL
jgi:serine/threonine protein phosphatase PrpC